MNPKPFIIFSLPRSRTAWLSLWLSQGPRLCGHDETIGAESIAGFCEKLQGLAGTVETGAIVGWRLLRKRLPDSRFLVLRRPLPDVMLSLIHAGIEYSPELLSELQARDVMLDALACEPGVHTIHFDDLRTSAICCWLVEELLGVEFDLARWHQMVDLNVQIDMERRKAALLRHEPGLMALRAEVQASPPHMGWN